MAAQGKKVTIVGMGRTAVAAARLLQALGAKPFVTDAASAEMLAAGRAALDELGVAYECGGHTEAAFADAALVVLSPGVPPNLPILARVREAGIGVLSELELAYHYCHSPIIAVTGTNGKTTTTELLRCLIAACGHSVVLAGNNETPFSEAVMVNPPPEYMVLEVSSYQLESAVRFRPWLAAVLNVTPDHLERHGSVEGYAGVKGRIFQAQGEGDIAIVNEDDDWAVDMGVPDGVEIWSFSQRECPPHGLWLSGDLICSGSKAVARRSDIPLLGRHNVENGLAALTMMCAGGFDWDKVLDGLRSFRGVEHRIEPVAALDGVDFYNDSKSTNVHSLRAALESFDRPVVLIAGGRGKGGDYGELRDLVRQRVKMLVVMGEDAPAIEAAFSGVAPLSWAADMAEAVGLAARAATRGDVVLLSPGCASFDMYENFEHRGRDFREHVRRYLQQGKEKAART
ncbi:MAG TPA: UDP-N-acetylmuramoyl-L-alanine--D-glutamate ligase [Candidatus Hydrogenedentes bacterium]|nr:UDP-N-acetylmuramoyl-L-alanine--D-glutamate ligase [Candidatus Hydrogenedentota bacterium]